MQVAQRNAPQCQLQSSAGAEAGGGTVEEVEVATGAEGGDSEDGGGREMRQIRGRHGEWSARGVRCKGRGRERRCSWGGDGDLAPIGHTGGDLS